jgi:hypothetical protein
MMLINKPFYTTEKQGFTVNPQIWGFMDIAENQMIKNLQQNTAQEIKLPKIEDMIGPDLKTRMEINFLRRVDKSIPTPEEWGGPKRRDRR